MGIKRVEEHMNNPEVPQQTLLAQAEQMSKMIEQLQLQTQNNPLAEAEMVKQQGTIAIAQGKLELEIEKLKIEAAKNNSKLIFDYDKLEAEQDVDVPGQGTSQ